MKFISKILLCSIAGFFFLLTLSQAQDAAPRFDAWRTPPAGEITKYTTIASIPAQFMRAIERAGCNIGDENYLRERPVTFFKPDHSGGPVVVANCIAFAGHGLAFEITHPRRELEPVKFVVISPERGLFVTARPGLITWDPKTNTLVATRRTDALGSIITRQTYVATRSLPERRADFDRSFSEVADGPFALIKVEISVANDPPSAWSTYWDVSMLPKLTRP